MPLTYKKIASVTVGAGGASTIDITSIPGTYTDLVLFLSLKSERNAQYDYPELRFNDSTTSYSDRYIYGNGSSVGSTTNTLIDYVIMGSQSGTTTALAFSNDFIYIPNYTSSNNKSVSLDTVAEANYTTNYMQLHAGLWSQSSAITKITIRNQFSLDWEQHSTATLYGISNS